MINVIRNIVVPCLTLSLFISCANNTKDEEDYPTVPLYKLTKKPDRYAHKTIVLTAYVLGTEFHPSESGAQFFILTLGEKPRTVIQEGKQIIFADIKNKIRAVEDGYNAGILKSSYIMAENARKLGLQITVIGEFKPNEPFYYYESGISLFIRQMRVGDTTVNTDYGDKSKFAHSTPGFLKKAYQGGKKIFKFVKDLL